MDLSNEERRLVARRKAQALQGHRNPQRDYSEALKRLREAPTGFQATQAKRQLSLCLVVIEDLMKIRQMGRS